MGADLRTLRKERGLKLEELALAAGVSAAMLYRLERHGAPMTAEMAARLAPYLGVDAEALERGHVEARLRRRASLTARCGA